MEGLGEVKRTGVVDHSEVLPQDEGHFMRDFPESQRVSGFFIPAMANESHPEDGAP